MRRRLRFLLRPRAARCVLPARMLVAAAPEVEFECNADANVHRALRSAPAGTLENLRPRVPSHALPLLEDLLAAWRTLDAIPGSSGLHGPPGEANILEARKNLAVLWGV